VNLTLNRPWSNISTAHRLIILDICAKLFVNPTRGSKDIKRTQNTVIQCLILDCDLDFEPTLVRHKHFTSSHHTWPEEVRDPHGDCGVQGNCFRGFRCSCPWWRYVRVTSSSIVCPGVSHVMLNPNLSSGLPLFSQACIWAINYWIILKILLSKLLLHNPRNLLRHFNTK